MFLTKTLLLAILPAIAMGGRINVFRREDSKQCGKFMCVSGKLSGNEVIWTLESLVPADKVGYMAWGTGQEMKDSQMVVVWRNPENGNTILSHRTPPCTKEDDGECNAHHKPQPFQPTTTATLVAGETDLKGDKAKVTFTRPWDGKASTNFIFGFSGKNPGSDPKAPLSFHTDFGTFPITLKP
ncbi:hypothetical protein HGRIS_003035 [Hohenbuehelia grisea]|uniref:DOMON domain-containing protein n=1 Tax=Hohenbuehelia grisea TaxID=104357 RepID=A0ABR3JN09_9AGAR